MLHLIHCHSDIDECLSSNGGCGQNCHNLEGSYECSCNAGFLLAGDNRTCEDVDECLTSPCNHTCDNLLGGFRCVCEEGYVLEEDGTSCAGKIIWVSLYARI